MGQQLGSTVSAIETGLFKAPAASGATGVVETAPKSIASAGIESRGGDTVTVYYQSGW